MVFIIPTYNTIGISLFWKDVLPSVTPAVVHPLPVPFLHSRRSSFIGVLLYQSSSYSGLSFILSPLPLRGVSATKKGMSYILKIRHYNFNDINTLLILSTWSKNLLTFARMTKIGTIDSLLCIAVSIYCVTKVFFSGSLLHV